MFLRFLGTDSKDVNNAVLTDLLAALDIVVMERLEKGSFRLIGQIPGWFTELYPDSAGNRDQARPERESG